MSTAVPEEAARHIRPATTGSPRVDEASESPGDESEHLGKDAEEDAEDHLITPEERVRVAMERRKENRDGTK